MSGKDGIRHHIEGEMSLNISRLLSIILEKNYQQNKTKPFQFWIIYIIVTSNQTELCSAIVSENILKMH